jgi:O-antigen/teichoic acid export membrane protein
LRNIRPRLVKGSLWITGGRATSNLLTVLSTIMLARILVPADFGLVALASTMLAILSAITNISMASALIHHRNPTPEHYHTAWTLSVVRGLLLALLFCALAWPASLFYRDARLDEVMYALSSVVILTGLANPRLIMMQKRLVFWQVFVLDIANNLVMAAVSIAIALIYDSYWALVLGAIAGQLTGTLLSYSLFPFRPRISWKHVRELWSFSMWLTLGQAINVLNYRVDHLLVGWFLGRAQLGYYTVGRNLAVMPSREAILPLTRTLFPAFSAVADDLVRLRRAYQRAQGVVTAVALPAGIGCALIADPLVRLAMGQKWAPAVPVIQVIAAVYAFQTLGSLIMPLAMATGRNRLLFNRSLQVFVLRLPIVTIGMVYWGLAGFLLGRSVVGVISMFINMSMVRSVTGLGILVQLRANHRCLIAVTTMALVVIGMGRLLPVPAAPAGWAASILLSIGVGASVYIATTLLLWIASGRPPGPEREALDMAKKLVGRLRRGKAAA